MLYLDLSIVICQADSGSIFKAGRKFKMMFLMSACRDFAVYYENSFFNLETSLPYCISVRAYFLFARISNKLQSAHRSFLLES